MSNDTNKLVEQLEKATAPGNAFDATLDADTRSLREGWLALDQLIEAAQPASACPPVVQYPTQAIASKRHGLVGTKTLSAAAVLAASLLVAALVTWSLVERLPNDGRQNQEIVKDQPNEAQSPSAVEKAQEPVLVKDQQSPSGSSGDDFDWDASLDSEIAAAGQEMLRIQSDWYASDDTSSAIYYRMQQMQQDLGGNAL